MMVRSLGMGIAFVTVVALAVPACADEDAPGTSGTGGSVGTGGNQTGGKPATGGTSGSGGASTGGKATGGAATGGGGSGGSDPGPTDGGCSPPRTLYYDTPGCGTNAPEPECGGPTWDACYMEVCSCDGVTLGGCGNFSKPWSHIGPCSDSGTPDGGKDASPD